MDNVEIEDMFSGLGPVSIRRMFGGKGIYHQGMIVALEVDGQILLKADGESSQRFADAGSRQWGYAREGKPEVMMPYWSIPDDAYDDPDIMADWVRIAFAAALRSDNGKAARTSKSGTKRGKRE